MPYYLNSADVFLLCSDREGSPTVVKEAIACGLPLVSTNIGDTSEIITSNSGIIIKKNNAKMLAEAIIVVNKKKWDKKYIVKSTSKFNWEIVAKNFILFFKSKLKTKNG